MELIAEGYGFSLKEGLINLIKMVGATIKRASVLPFAPKEDTRALLNERTENFMKKYGNQVLRMAYAYVHNMDEAEDILQETLIKILEVNLDSDDEEYIKAYFLRTASNIAKNHISANKRHETDELNEELAAEEKADLSFVWEAVKELPDTQRDVIHLFYEEGYQTAEIAEILGRKEATIRSDLKRARERLKTILKEVYDFE
jgi:RNA polymerase sigma factor, sigma-70 family